MNSIIELLRRQNRISVIVVSILIGTLLIYLSIFEPFLYIFIPVEVFFVMHYLKFYRFKPRLLGATVIFYILVIIASGIYGPALYSSSGVEYHPFNNGTNITAAVTPFNNISNEYNFSFTIAGNQSIGSYYIVIVGIFNSYHRLNLSEQNITVGYNQSHDLVLSYQVNNLTPSGLYEYCLYFGKNLSKAASVNSYGPVFSAAAAFEFYLLNLSIPWMLLFELVFVVGLLIARSISNSAKMRNIPPKVPPPPDQPQPGTIDGDKTQ